MRTYEGTIKAKQPDFEGKTEMEKAQDIFEIEQFLNGKLVALEIYQKWGVGIRFHIQEEKEEKSCRLGIKW